MTVIINKRNRINRSLVLLIRDKTSCLKAVTRNLWFDTTTESAAHRFVQIHNIYLMYGQYKIH